MDKNTKIPSHKNNNIYNNIHILQKNDNGEITAAKEGEENIYSTCYGPATDNQIQQMKSEKKEKIYNQTSVTLKRPKVFKFIFCLFIKSNFLAIQKNCFL